MLHFMVPLTLPERIEVSVRLNQRETNVISVQTIEIGKDSLK
jgi:hypothetical protein